MKNVIILLALLTLPQLGFGQAECGDLNYDANIDLDDYTYLIQYMFHDGPMPIVAEFGYLPAQFGDRRRERSGRCGDRRGADLGYNEAHRSSW